MGEGDGVGVGVGVALTVGVGLRVGVAVGVAEAVGEGVGVAGRGIVRAAPATTGGDSGFPLVSTSWTAKICSPELSCVQVKFLSVVEKLALGVCRVGVGLTARLAEVGIESR